MAVTGLAWFGFLIGHLAGNLLLTQGPNAFNEYAKKLHSLGPLLYIAEAGLVILLVGHVFSALRVTQENMSARPQGYAHLKRRRATLFSKTMLYGGYILFVFLIVHIISFKFGPHASHPLGLYGIVIDTFKNPLWVVGYVVSLIFLGMHLSHGIDSAAQTLGLSSDSWRKRLRTSGIVAARLITVGFIFLPIWALFFA